MSHPDKKGLSKPTMLDMALDLHRKGHHIIPLKANDKRPKIRRWAQYQTEQSSEEQINKWWARTPYANIGLITGITVNVIDCDSLEACKWVEKNLPYTPWTVTTAKGKHYYFHAANNGIKNSVGANHIDIRGVGGYVVAAGSTHATGALYTEHKAQGVDCSYDNLPTLTPSIISDIEKYNESNAKTADGKSVYKTKTLIQAARQLGKNVYVLNMQDVDTSYVGEGVSEGGRNHALAKKAGLWFSEGDSYDECLSHARELNDKNDPPLDDLEVVGIVKSIHRKHSDSQQQAESKPVRGSEATNESLDDDDYQWSDSGTMESYNGEYPLHLLPQGIRSAIAEVQEYVQAPVAMVAQVALAGLSTVAHSHFDVARDTQLSGPISLYLMTVAESGERKSAIEKFFTKSIDAYDDKQLITNKAKFKTYNATLASWEAKHSAITGKIKSAVIAGKDCSELDEQLEKLEDEKPEKPYPRRLIRRDTTIEALLFQLSNGSSSAAIVSDEAGIILGGHSMKGENRMQNVSYQNQMWSGTDVLVDRKGEGQSFHVKNPRLTMSLQVQRSVLESFDKAGGDLIRGSGWYARYLMTDPESTQGHRPYLPPPEFMDFADEFNTRIAQIIELTPRWVDGQIVREVLSFSPEVKKLWSKFYNQTEIEQKDGGKYRRLRDTASKAGENAARLAANFSVYDNPDNPLITTDHMRAGTQLAHWYLDEALRISGGESIRFCTKAKKLLDWVVAKCKETGESELQKNYVRQSGPNACRGTVFNGFFKELKNAGVMRDFKVNKIWYIQAHPDYFQNSSERC